MAERFNSTQCKDMIIHLITNSIRRAVQILKLRTHHNIAFVIPKPAIIVSNKLISNFKEPSRYSSQVKINTTHYIYTIIQEEKGLTSAIKVAKIESTSHDGYMLNNTIP